MKYVRHPLRLLSRSLGAKLFVSHFLVALVGTFMLLAAIYLVAPVIFGRLMSNMMESTPGMMSSGSSMMDSEQMAGMEEMMDPVDRAFGSTLLYSLLVAGVVATATAALTSLFVSRRIVTPLSIMLVATRRISAGRYDERVPAGEVDELGALSESFNSMAASLQAAEERRLDLIGDVSHELRTPLSTLQGYMEGFMERVVEPSEETWALLYGEAERMRRVVDDLSQLSRAEAGRLELKRAEVFPAEVVRVAIERMLPLFKEKGVEFASAIPENLPPVSADGDRVVQILTNLLSNALRHTPAGGWITVKAEAQGDSVVFKVEDAGEGIASEHLPHLFERFYRVEKSRSREGGGSGVGLAISRALVDAMGGRIWVESPGLGKGATFTFTLPVF